MFTAPVERSNTKLETLLKDLIMDRVRTLYSQHDTIKVVKKNFFKSCRNRRNICTVHKNSVATIFLLGCVGTGGQSVSVRCD